MRQVLSSKRFWKRISPGKLFILRIVSSSPDGVLHCCLIDLIDSFININNCDNRLLRVNNMEIVNSCYINLNVIFCYNFLFRDFLGHCTKRYLSH